MAAVLATFEHHSAPRGPKKARTGEEDHEKNRQHGDGPGAPSSPAGALQSLRRAWQYAAHGADP